MHRKNRDVAGPLGELAWLFLKLGAIAFGGPAAHIAMMEDEVVRRRQWLTREEFLDLLGATNLIPGPNSTEMAIHIGHRRAGWPGLLVAGACFILPATLIVMACAWAYVRFGKLPQAEGLLYGIKPVIIAVVVQALWGLGRTALKTRALAVLGVACLAGSFAGVNELLLLAVAGLVMAFARGLNARPGANAPPPSSDAPSPRAPPNTDTTPSRRSIRAPIWIPLGVLLVSTGLIRWLDFDQQLQAAFWSAQDGWRWARWPEVRFLYHYGTWPALMAGVAGAIIYLASRITGRWQRARRLGLFLALLLALGPGLVVNVIFKDHSGRPRPAQTHEFGGDQTFRAVGEPGPSGAGRSFPSGHASMGFYWMGLFAFFWRERRRWAWGFGVLGLVHGMLMGFARIAQGGHWPSDVLWSAGFTYLTAWLLQVGLANASSFLANVLQRCRTPEGTGIGPMLGVTPLASLTNGTVATTGAAAGIMVQAAAATPFGLWPLFLFFLKVGSVLYGSGYVLLAFLRSGLVERFGWLTEAQLLDAVAIGQITPGPVFTTATFIGYILGGTPAALIATIGIFLPAFFFVAVSGPLVPRIRRSPVAGAFLDGVNAASLALMAVVTFQLTGAALVDWLTILLAVAAAFLLVRYKLNSAWLVAGGALLGFVKVFL